MKKTKSRSGPTIDESERRKRGQVLVGVRLSREESELVGRACEKRGLLRPALLRLALREWLETQR